MTSQLWSFPCLVVVAMKRNGEPAVRSAPNDRSCVAYPTFSEACPYIRLCQRHEVEQSVLTWLLSPSVFVSAFFHLRLYLERIFSSMAKIAAFNSESIRYSQQAADLTNEAPWFNYRRVHEPFLFSKNSKSALYLNPPSFNLITKYIYIYFYYVTQRDGLH